MGFLSDFISTVEDVGTLGATYVGRKYLGIPPEDILTGGAAFAARKLGLYGGSDPSMPSLLAPPLPPDATDEEIRKAVLMQRRRLLLGQGQGSTFISGSMGDTSAIPTSKSSAGGF